MQENTRNWSEQCTQHISFITVCTVILDLQGTCSEFTIMEPLEKQTADVAISSTVGRVFTLNGKYIPAL